MKSSRAPAMWFILVTLFIDVAGLGIIIPVMPKLITHLTGGTMSDAARWGGFLAFAFYKEPHRSGRRRWLKDRHW